MYYLKHGRERFDKSDSEVSSQNIVETWVFALRDLSEIVLYLYSMLGTVKSRHSKGSVTLNMVGSVWFTRDPL